MSLYIPKIKSTFEERVYNAVYQNNILRIKKLLSRHHCLVLRYFEGESLLHLAVHFRRFEIFELLVKRPERNLELKSLYGRTSILTHAIEWHKEYPEPADSMYCIRRLLELGANVNTIDRRNRSPLHVSCRRGYDKCIHLLLEYGADPQVTNLDGSTPFEEAARGGCSIDTLQILFQITYDDLEPIVLRLSTVTGLLLNDQVNFLETILPRVSKLHIPSIASVILLEYNLHKLPFRMFEQMISKFSGIVEHIHNLTELNMKNYVNESPDVVQYLNFFMDNCHHLEKFDARSLIGTPQKVPIDHVFGVLLRLLSKGVELTLDLDKLYPYHGFSPLFEDLMHILALHEEFSEYRFYFAGPGDVPSFTQLGRDQSRKTIIQCYDVETPSQFEEVLKDLKLPELFHDVLLFKAKMYY